MLETGEIQTQNPCIGLGLHGFIDSSWRGYVDEENVVISLPKSILKQHFEIIL